MSQEAVANPTIMPERMCENKGKDKPARIHRTGMILVLHFIFILYFVYFPPMLFVYICVLIVLLKVQEDLVLF